MGPRNGVGVRGTRKIGMCLVGSDLQVYPEAARVVGNFTIHTFVHIDENSLHSQAGIPPITHDPMTRNMTKRIKRDNQLQYSGPVVLPTGGGLDNRTTRLNVSIAVDCTTNSAGKASGTFTSSPVSTSDWAPIQSVYQEYRVLGFEVEYIPWFTVPQVGGVLPSVGAFDAVHYSAASTPTSRDMLLQNAYHKIWHSHKPLKITWKARGTEEMQWVEAGVGNDNGSIRWYMDGLSASSTYGIFTVTYLVELRGRR